MIILCQITDQSYKHSGQWFISRDRKFYLHSDGIWRLSTSFQGEYTGYFMNRGDAVALLEKMGLKYREGTW